MAGMSFGASAPGYGGTPMAALQGQASMGAPKILGKNLGGQGPFNAGTPSLIPKATGATTEAQNQWLAPGNMPIDEGKIAYERSLEAAKQQAGYGTAATKQGFDLGEQGKLSSYALGQKGADANQSRLFGALDKLGINSLISQTSGGGAGAAPPRESGGDADWNAANAAAMGRAKDQSALAVGAAQRAMQNNMAQRGISGSGIEAQQDMGIQLAGAGQLGAAGRQIAEGTAARAGAVAERNYAGGITQRGQDIQANDASAARKQQLIQSLMGLFNVSASY